MGLLIKGSDIFVDSSSFIARKFNVSELIIGLTIVSIGTSLPELGTNIYSSVIGSSSIPMGNIVGSNIANICLVLGVGAVLSGNISINESVKRRDGLFMILTFIVLFVIGIACRIIFRTSGKAGIFSGAILLALFLIYYFVLFRTMKNEPQSSTCKDSTKEYKNIITAFIVLALGFGLITLGAKALIDNVVWFATKFSIPQEIIAATIVAFGTSVPELAVTVAGVIKGKHDIAVGNIIGSCIINIIFILGISAVISPLKISFDMLYILIPIMVISGILLLSLSWRKNRLSRLGGAILLLIYILVIAFSVFKSISF